MAVPQLVENASPQARFARNAPPQRLVCERFAAAVTEHELVGPDFGQALQFGDGRTRESRGDRVAVFRAMDGERAGVEIDVLAPHPEDRADAQARVIGDGDERRHLAPLAIHNARDSQDALDFLGPADSARDRHARASVRCRASER